MDRKRHLILIAVFAGIGLIGSLIVGMVNDGGVIVVLIFALIFAVIGAIFGLSIVPWLAYIKKWAGIHFDGFNGEFAFSMLFTIIWATIRSPFVGIYQLVKDDYL